MAKTIKVILVGEGILKEKLKGLSNAEAKKAIMGATREAVKIIQKEAQRNAPKKTGALKRSIKVRAIRRSRKRIGMRVTTSKLDSLYQGKTFYGAFQEFGWKTGSRKSAVRKQIDGREFMKRAANSRADDALEMFRARIDDHIKKVMAKRK